MLNKTTGQPQDTSQTIEIIEEELRKNKQEFKDTDSNNLSIDDDEMEMEIALLEQFMEDNAEDQQTLSKLERSKELLIQRKSMLQIKKDILKYESPVTTGESLIKSDSNLINQAHAIKEELIQLERYFTNEWGFQLSRNPASAQFAALLQVTLSEELLLDYKEMIQSLKKMRDSALKLLDDAEIDISQDLESSVKQELIDLREQIERFKKRNFMKQVSKSQMQESELQRIVTFFDEIKSLINQKQEIEVQLPQLQMQMSKLENVQQEQEKEEEKKQHVMEGQSDEPENDSEFFNIMNEMRYYSGVPEGCFEKYLTQVLCAIFLKTCSPTISQYSKLEQYLDQNLQDEKNLDSIISNGISMLKKLREEEKIENKKIINLLSQLIDLKLPVQKDILLVLKKNQIFWQILSELRKFHFSLFFDYWEEVKQVAELVEGMDIVLFMGTTGCGKSTTIQYLCGSEMYRTKVNGLEHIGYTNIQNQDLKDIKTSPFAQPKTQFIKLIKIDQKNQNQQTIQMNLVDSPGVFDTKSAEIDVSNQIGIYEAFCRAKTVKPVIILSVIKFGDRGQDFKTIIRYYACMLQDIELLNYFYFIFTHVKQHTIETLKNLLFEFKETEQNSLDKDEVVIQFIEIILEKFDSGTVSLINPLEPSEVFPILQRIQKGHPIRRPEQVFQKIVLESSKICINEQIDIHQQEVLNAIKTFKNEDYAIYKLEQLKRYAQILDQYQEYNHCIIKISQILNKEFENICSQIGTALKKENNVTSSDINDIKNKYEYLNKFEKLRWKFLNQGDNKVKSANQIIDYISTQIANSLKFGSEEGFFELNSEFFHRQLAKLEYLCLTKFKKLIETRDFIYKDFTKQLQNKKSQIIDQIKLFISIDNQEQMKNDEKNQNKFYSELSTFFSNVEKGIQLNKIESLRNLMETILNDINIEINKRFEEIQTEKLNNLYSLSKKSNNDLSDLQLKSLQDLESEITFYITNDFMKSIKQYYEILHKFSLSLRMSSKFNLYLDTDKRKKHLVRLLVFWFYVQEEVIRKSIDDGQNYPQIEKIYNQVMYLNDAGIVDSEISSRYNRLKNNLLSLLEKKQEEIKLIIPKLSEGIEIIQDQGINAYMNNQPVSEYKIISLREAVKIIKYLSWIMPDARKDYLSANKLFLLENLERLVEVIQDKMDDQRLEIENIEDFQNVSKVFKFIEQISEIASILDVKLKSNSLNKFRPQIERSLLQIQSFIENMKNPFQKQDYMVEDQKKEEEKGYNNREKIQQKLHLLQIHECLRLIDYYQYLKTIKNNDQLIKAIESFSKSQSEDNQEESQLVEPAKQIDLKQKIQTLCYKAEQFINHKIGIIHADFKNKIEAILSQTQVFNNKNQFWEISDENKDHEIDKIYRSNFIDDDFKSRINLLNQDLNQRILQIPNNATNAPRLYNMLRISQYLLPLGSYTGEQESFQKSYLNSYARVAGLNTDVVETAKQHILNSEYGEILKMIEELENLNEPHSIENIQNIKNEVQNRCRQLYYQIEINSKQMLISDQIMTIFEQKDDSTQIDLNQAVKELICIKENDKLCIILGDDTFNRVTKAIESLNNRLQYHHEQSATEIKYLLECNNFFEADELIKKELQFLSYIDMSENNKKYQDALNVFQSTLKEKLAQVHEKFNCKNQDFNKDFINLKDKKPNEIYKNLGKSTSKQSPEFAQAQKRIIETLKETMKNRVQYLEDHITSDSFLIYLRQSYSSLASMPQQIRDEYQDKLEMIEKNYKEKAKIEQDRLTFALKANYDLDK